MPLDIYTPFDLAEVMFDPRQTVSTNAWLSRFYPGSHMSAQEQIMFDEIGASRPIAPFMLPNVAGRPIYRREGERIRAFKPAYTKPKDACRPGSALSLQPGELTRRLALQTPQARFDAEVIRIAQFHRNAIQRLWDYMGARALIDGKLTINYHAEAGTPVKPVVIDFERAAGHTITLGAGSRWGDAGVKAFDDIQAWVDTMAAAKFGGSATDLMLGAQAAAAFMADQSIKDKFNTQVRGTESVMFDQGILRTDPMDPFTYLGTLGSGLRVWRVSGPGNTFESGDGTFVDILGKKQALLVSPSVMGIKCFGAILDVDYDLQPAEIFAKMWDNPDPSARFIMSQSAPLMVPVNANCTLLVNVLA